MSDIFISYSNHDRDRVQPLVHALVARGWSVFWDRATPVGMTWRAFIGRELECCRAMVVVWSDTSVESRWVLEEAEDGVQRQILFPVRIDEVPPPFGFRSVQVGDLVGKTGADFDAVVEHLVEQLMLVLGPPPGQQREDDVDRVQRVAAEIERVKEAERLRREAEDAARRQREAAALEHQQEAERERRAAAERQRQSEVAAEHERQRANDNAPASAADAPPGGWARLFKHGRWPVIVGSGVGVALVVALGFAVVGDGEAGNLGDVVEGVRGGLMGKHDETGGDESDTAGDSDTGGPKTITVKGVELVLVPGGTFTMGSAKSEDGHQSNEEPQHEVTLAPFYLAKTEVTNAQYKLYLDANPDAPKPEYWENSKYNQPQQPVVGVSWNDAKAYCEWAGLVLPTEAQWEYAARGGTTTRYWSGDEESDLARVGWYEENSGEKLHLVGEKDANAFGLFDVHGNVWEWCRDKYVDNYEAKPQPGDGLRHEPVGVANRVIRGGGWFNVAVGARSALRDRFYPGNRNFNVGFRPAQVIP